MRLLLIVLTLSVALLIPINAIAEVSGEYTIAVVPQFTAL